MLLFDGLYVNNSGGKILLDYLITQLEKEEIEVHYLLDNRIRNNHPFIKTNQVTYLKANLLNRHKFYKYNLVKFTKVFCFGNLPPTFSLNIPVYTYFHQFLFLQTINVGNIIFKIKKTILYSLRKNTDLWIVQSEMVKRKLSLELKTDRDKINVIPFYPILENDVLDFKRNKRGYVYISNGGAHKNHVNLIEAFCRFCDNDNTGVLHLTISKEFPSLLNLITKKIDLGYPIVNHGFLPRHRLSEIYLSNEYIIYPSFSESFGLGLIEGIENGCKVIGANLPYTFAVCSPSIVFNPSNIKDISNALVRSQTSEVKPTKQLVFSQLNDLMSILK